MHGNVSEIFGLIVLFINLVIVISVLFDIAGTKKNEAE